MTVYVAERPVLILGATGQIGRALCATYGNAAMGLSSKQLNFLQPELIRTTLDVYNPSAIINAAAYTQVDKAQEDFASAVAINAVAPGIIAGWCRDKSIPFIHYSTDYVFDGTGSRAWTEQDSPSPINAYGTSKLQGELQIQQAGGNYIILRTSWVFAPQGANFVNTMLRLAEEKETLRVVNDQMGAPTYAEDIAAATVHLLAQAQKQKEFPSDIYHLCSAGETNWHDFTQHIFSVWQELGHILKIKDLQPITTKDYPTAAQRPSNSRLNCAKIKNHFGISLPTWQDAIRRCLEKKSESF